jgi:hypothetical protein
MAQRIRKYPIALKKAIRPLVATMRYRGVETRDVLIASYPRSGSTWLRFLLYEVLVGRSPNWQEVNNGIPYVGWHRDAPRLLPDEARVIKTHDKKRGPCERVVYLVRDPRDVVLSEYRLSLRGGGRRQLDDFVAAAAAGKTSPFGSWSDHVEHWLGGNSAGTDNLLRLRFEDLRADTARTLQNVLGFMRATVDPDAVEQAIVNNSLSRMKEKEDRAPADEVKKTPTTHRFVSEGSVKGWRKKMTEQQAMLIEDASRHWLIELGYPVREDVQQ